MKNRKVSILLLLFFSTMLASPPLVEAQDKMSVGGLVGASSYTGDFNPNGLMRRPGAYMGGLIHYAMSEYYGLRIGLGAGNLRGSPASYNGRLMSNVSYQKPTAFNQLFFDVEARMEAGFLPYDPLEHNPKKQSFSPYFALGMGLAYSRGAPFVQFPIAVGIRYRVAYRFTLGAEWTFRKTFNDKLDGWENVRVSPGTGTLNNNDWISYIGIYLTYQLSPKECCHELN